MGTLPEVQLADTAYGSQSNVEKCAEAGVKLVAPTPGKGSAKVSTNQDETKAAAGVGEAVAQQTTAVATEGEETELRELSRREKLENRRAMEQTPEWKKEYRKRSGIEGVHEAVDRTTGIKELRVRGAKAVNTAIWLKVTGWNIRTAAKIAANRGRTPKNGPTTPTTTAKTAEIRRRTRDARGARTPLARKAGFRTDFRRKSEFGFLGRSLCAQG
jgi:hypothetical protein